MSAGNALSCSGQNSPLFDSGAIHHIVCQPTYLRNLRHSKVHAITLGGGESHPVKGEGNQLIYSSDTDIEALLTVVLFVSSLNCNLFTGAQMTAKVVMCEQRGAALIVKSRKGQPVLRGTRQGSLYYVNCEFVLPAEGQVHVSLHAWHNRLSHPALSALKRIAREKKCAWSWRCSE
jgi:hypothetical protein